MDTKMRIKFLGSGSAFTVGDNNYHSNILIEKNGRRLLLDCGGDIRFSLHEAGLRMSDIDEIYVSHLHSDHVGGLEYAAFFTYFIPNRPKTTIHLSRNIVSDLWTKTLSGGLSSIEGQVMTIEDYFNINPIKNNGNFSFEGTNFQLVQVVHIMNGFSIVPSFGLIFEEGGKKVFWTSDTQFAPAQINKFYQMADIIFHDCETAPYKSGVHSHYSDLKTLPDDIRKKMWLYHYQSGEKPDAVADGFQGFVKKGQEFHL